MGNSCSFLHFSSKYTSSFPQQSVILLPLRVGCFSLNVSVESVYECMSQCNGPTHFPHVGQRTGKERRAGSSVEYALQLLDRYTLNKL